MAIQVSKAALHYRLAQLRVRGVAPWARFMEVIKEERERADVFRHQTLTRRVFGLWKLLTSRRLAGREQVARQFQIKLTIRRAMQQWREVSLKSDQLTVCACALHNTYACRYLFLSQLMSLLYLFLSQLVSLLYMFLSQLVSLLYMFLSQLVSLLSQLMSLLYLTMYVSYTVCGSLEDYGRLCCYLTARAAN